MRGVVDGTGHSPFWEAIGRHFFDIEFPKAETMTTVSKNFIADLMPKHPIYVALLPTSAQETIGKVHPQTEPALAMLKHEGFEQQGLIDIFDGGPVVHAARDSIRSVHESREALIDAIDESLAGDSMLIANVRDSGFRCVLGPIRVPTSQTADDKQSPAISVAIDRVTALSLGVKIGDRVRYVAPR